MATKSAAASAVEKHDGWQLEHEAEPSSVKTGHGTFLVNEGEYRAVKRVGLTVKEIVASTPEQLNDRIADWERMQPSTEETPGPTREQLINSAKATVASLQTAGARPSADVDLTPAATAAKAEAVNVSIPPVVEVTKLDKDDAALVAAASTGPKTEGLGSGTTPGT